MVNSSTAILDSLTISNSLVFHSENHSYSSAEVDLINMWIGNLNSTLYEKN